MNGIDRFYYEAAYLAALMCWLIENKSDNQADEEIASIITLKPFMTPILFDVMKSFESHCG